VPYPKRATSPCPDPTAICVDDSYSCSEHPYSGGTCHGHGGENALDIVSLLVTWLAAYGEPVEGTAFGRYRLIELLGRGGMGEVWRAYDTETKRTVAIKVLPPHLADDSDFVRRFRREAEAAAQLNSPHVVPIHNYGEIDGRLYVDMRLVEGRDLQTVLANGPLEPARSVRII
jgi:hypothetical protein